MSFTPDPLLNGGAHAPRYLRTQWDEKQARDFGPWRLGRAPDPTDGLTSLPQTQHAGNVGPDDDINDESSQVLPDHTLAEQAPATTSDAPMQQPAARQPATVVQAVHAQLNEEQIRVIRQQGYVQGLKDGMAKTLLDLETERHKERELIRNITIELKSLQQDASRLFSPLKRLSVHIAEQLVRGELSVSGQAIERLVRACLSELNGQEKSVLLTMNPSDLESAKPLLSELGAEWEIEGDASMLPGSVRLRANDLLVEDLITHRLEDLAREMMADHQQWMKTSSSLTKVTAEPVETAINPSRWKRETQAIEDVQDTASEQLSSAREEDNFPPNEPSESP